MPSYLNPINLAYIDALEREYREDPARMDPSWRFFFDGLATVSQSNGKGGVSQEHLEFEVKVLKLIQGYREMGHLIADVNPLNRGIQSHPLLELSNFGLTENDLDKTCDVGQVLGFGAMPLRQIIRALTTYYCSPVAVEYGHIDDPQCRRWIQERVESNFLSQQLPLELKLRTLQKLCEAEVLENFLHTRFVGSKRFSIEGNDVIIPMLDFLIDESTRLGADEIILGMAHRGRLNVLANIFQKDLRIMLAEFSGHLDAKQGDGDVKYHMGFSQNTQSFTGKPVHLSLMPNPSHLEAVNSVLMGVTRAKQKLKGDDRIRTLAVLLHGDASFSGQGVIYETLNMSELAGYAIGGTIHIIINNQIGYTALPSEQHSTPQATDVAKMLEIPIFRVNADEVEPAMRSISLAVQYRYKFRRDVVIDLVGYRRYGHNEGDEPTYTQPLMYMEIAQHPRVLEIYRHQLLKAGAIDENLHTTLIDAQVHKLEQALNEARKSAVSPRMHAFGDRWEKLEKASDKNLFIKAQTGVPLKRLVDIGHQLLQIPDGFKLHPKLKKNLENRRAMVAGRHPIDWSLSEALAFGTLMEEGFPVRLTGQDSERGTFSHRHATFHDVETGDKFTPLNNLKNVKADFEIINSLLSEYAALGFEFGQSLANPGKLTIWEAQFGDFVNGAQIIIDQFITSAAVKWQRYSGLTLFLPHGQEGQGPEHSSARLERFLQACAQNNIQVCNVTTPAQLFHMLRRQLHRSFRLPLIVMTPKSLLRHASVVSPLEELEKGVFQEVIDDPDPTLKDKAKRLVLCSGKIYYELLEARKTVNNKDVALIRVEQFYPFPREELGGILASYKASADVVWCQEGPQNTEGWGFMLQCLSPLLGSQHTLSYVGRPAQASPADGYTHLYAKEQKRIALTALGEI